MLYCLLFSSLYSDSCLSRLSLSFFSYSICSFRPFSVSFSYFIRTSLVLHYIIVLFKSCSYSLILLKYDMFYCWFAAQILIWSYSFASNSLTVSVNLKYLVTLSFSIIWLFKDVLVVLDAYNWESNVECDELSRSWTPMDPLTYSPDY